jgi:hypothetical protein
MSHPLNFKPLRSALFALAVLSDRSMPTACDMRRIMPAFGKLKTPSYLSVIAGRVSP